MIIRILRIMYFLAYCLCDKTAPPDSPVFKGFYSRFKKPDEIKDEDLDKELKRLLDEALKN